MKDNELIRNGYLTAIKNFEIALEEIDKKYNTFVKIDFETKEAISNDGSFMRYHRNINLKEITII